MDPWLLASWVPPSKTLELDVGVAVLGGRNENAWLHLPLLPCLLCLLTPASARMHMHTRIPPRNLCIQVFLSAGHLVFCLISGWVKKWMDGGIDGGVAG